jgi:hypothetical protein
MSKTMKNACFLIFCSFLGSFWATEYKYFFHFLEPQKTVHLFLRKGYLCYDNAGICLWCFCVYPFLIFFRKQLDL